MRDWQVVASVFQKILRGQNSHGMTRFRSLSSYDVLKHGGGTSQAIFFWIKAFLDSGVVKCGNEVPATTICRGSHQRELKNWRRKVNSGISIQSADRPDIEFKVAWDVIESGKFGNGFFDVTSNSELDSRVIGWLYLGAALDFYASFFELFLIYL